MKLCPVCQTEYPDEKKFCENDGTALRAASPAADLVGQIIAERYHVVKKLGEGGMGQVYLAEHVKMGRRSAIKVMNPAMAHDPDAVARFNREASNASRITHPHVCAVYDFGETPDGLIYLAMEFVEGEPLTAVIEREDALPLARAVRIFRQTADALQAAHDLGIVHRDLKPDNIMVARGRDGGDVVKVVDFGIAKAVGGDEAGQKVTKTGLVVGTPEFMSPEQLSGDRLDGRSDLYSLALVLYRMLTGRLPFEAETVQEIMIKRLTDEPTPLAAARPDLAFPPGLQPVMDRALAKIPGERWQAVADFAAAVDRAVGGAAAPAGADAHTQILDGGKTAVAATKAVPPTRAPAPAARRSKLPVYAGAGVVVVAIAVAVALKFGGAKSPAAPQHPGADSTAQQASGTAAPAGGPATRPNRTAPPGGGTERNASEASRGTAPGPRAAPYDASGILTGFENLAKRLDDGPAAQRLALDSAQHVYDAQPALPPEVRLQAALLAANAQISLGDQTAACRWATRMLPLVPPSDTTHRNLANALCGRGQ